MVAVAGGVANGWGVRRSAGEGLGEGEGWAAWRWWAVGPVGDGGFGRVR